MHRSTLILFPQVFFLILCSSKKRAIFIHPPNTPNLINILHIKSPLPAMNGRQWNETRDRDVKETETSSWTHTPHYGNETKEWMLAADIQSNKEEPANIQTYHACSLLLPPVINQRLEKNKSSQSFQNYVFLSLTTVIAYTYSTCPYEVVTYVDSKVWALWVWIPLLTLTNSWQWVGT